MKKIANEYKKNRTILVQRVPTRWNSNLKQLRFILDLDWCLAKMAETSSVIEELMPNNDKIHIVKGAIIFAMGEDVKKAATQAILEIRRKTRHQRRILLMTLLMKMPRGVHLKSPMAVTLPNRF